MTAEVPTPETEDPRAAIWHDDVLERRRFAEFLTKALTEQTRVVSKSERQPRGLTVALDAGWGTGKTFFVKHWADDLKQRGHPVVFFDAWENDLGEEAAIALMAAIKETIDEWVARMPAKHELAARAGEMVRDGVKELRRAVLPASKVVAAGMLKKFTGIGVKEFMDAVDGDDALSAEPQEELSNEKIEAGLDKIFESALGEQKKRGEAIKNFKASMSKALQLIDQNTEANLPAFVFVDELDRCRPSYAINLLEEIKHIFGMPNVCFIVSTNLDQLSHSARAIYGTGFDASGYLKRFFDQCFVLPEPSHEKYIQLLLVETKNINTRDYSLGLPQLIKPGGARTPYYAISLVFDAMDLDLRSQRQVFIIADLVASSIGVQNKIFLIWLFFLCALIHKNPEAFNLMFRKKDSGLVLNTILEKEIKNTIKIKEMDYDKYGRATKEKETDLLEIIKNYHSWSNQELSFIGKDLEEANYPQSNAIDIYNEMPSPRLTGKKYYPSISQYMRLVKFAGYAQQRSFD